MNIQTAKITRESFDNYFIWMASTADGNVISRNALVSEVPGEHVTAMKTRCKESEEQAKREFIEAVCAGQTVEERFKLWLALGEDDTERAYFKLARKSNPTDPALDSWELKCMHVTHDSMPLWTVVTADPREYSCQYADYTAETVRLVSAFRYNLRLALASDINVLHDSKGGTEPGASVVSIVKDKALDALVKRNAQPPAGYKKACEARPEFAQHGREALAKQVSVILAQLTGREFFVKRSQIRALETALFKTAGADLKAVNAPQLVGLLIDWLAHWAKGTVPDIR